MNPYEHDEPAADLCDHGMAPDELCEECDDAAGIRRCPHGVIYDGIELRCEDCGDAAEQESLSAYYGSSSSQTDQERYDVASREKRGRR